MNYRDSIKGMKFSFSFECGECNARGQTPQFPLWETGKLPEWEGNVARDMRKIHQSKTPGCRGTLYATMTKHYA